jgi:ankyrin
VFTYSSKNFLKKTLKDSNVLAIKQMVIEAQNGVMEHTMAELFTKAYFTPSKKYFSKKTFDDLKQVSTKDDSNRTSPLHYAAEIGHLTICLLMTEKMKDKCPKTKLGCTPIHTAAYHGHLEVCRLMMEFSRDKNPKDFDLGRTPLHLAARKGHLHVFKLIINSAKNKNPKTINGVTPLHLAARYGHVNICQLILENISLDFRKSLQAGLRMSQIKSQNIIYNPPNKSGWTPLHIASEFGQYHVVQLILKYVENKNPQNKKSSETTPMELAEFYGYPAIRCLIQNALDRQNPEQAVKRRRSL